MHLGVNLCACWDTKRGVVLVRPARELPVEDLYSVERLATMPERPPSAASFDPSQTVRQRLGPAQLWRAVLSARAALADERNLVGSPEASARDALVEALESYVTSLAERGHPVPYALRDELRLQRSTSAAIRGRSGDPR